MEGSIRNRSTKYQWFSTRRLDFLGVCASFLSGIKFDLSKLLHLIFQKVLLQSGDGSTVLVNGTNDDWNDEAYLIRRRALYALIYLCQGSAQTLGPYLEPMMSQVFSRLNSATVRNWHWIMNRCSGSKYRASSTSGSHDVCSNCNPLLCDSSKSVWGLVMHLLMS